MPNNDSISRWIQEVKSGKKDAEHDLWNRCFPDLVRLANQRLQGIRRAVEDEEDVAAKALKSFFSAIRRDRYPDLAGRDSLWRLLKKITKDKAIDAIRRHDRQPPVVDGSVVNTITAPDVYTVRVDDADNGDLISRVATIMTEEVRRLLDLLGDAELETIALGKLERDTNEEIANELDCSVRTVERRLNLIRRKWQLEQLS